jgi:hypothetical protein
LNDGSIKEQEVDVDWARGETRRATRTTDGQLDVTRKALERGSIEFGAKRRRNVEVCRALCSVRRLGFIKGRYGEYLNASAQTLQGGQNITLPVSQVGPDPDIELVHENFLRAASSQARPALTE